MPNDLSPRLLIVEDDDVLRERLSRAMEKRNVFDVHAADSVAMAQQMIEADRFDYAIVDLRLLDGSGLDVVRMIEDRNERARAVILTGYGDIPTAVSAARLGAVDYIAKPADATEIIDVLLAPEGAMPPAPENPIKPEAARIAQIERVFREADGNVSETARLLSMHRRTLQRLLRKYDISAADAKQHGSG